MSNANSIHQLADQLEAILFVATDPLSLKQLAQTTAATPANVSAALAIVDQHLTGGIRLSQLDHTYRLVTAPDTTPIVRQFLQDQSKSDLTRPALETLAIVAYRGPLTKSQIEHIRGVASDTMIRNLLARGLITEAGKSPEPGRPFLYQVSHSFLQHFGLTSPADLPPLADQTASSDIPTDPINPSETSDETPDAH